MKFYFRTLGCKMNWLDTARLSAALHEAGHTIVREEEEAEYVVVNTCTVTGEADRKSRQTVNAAGKLQKQVAVIGCGPKVEHEKWQQQANDSLVFSHEHALLDHFGIDSEKLPFPLNSRTRLPLAIQHGCDNACSFCITRVARGRHESVNSSEIVEQFKQAEQLGIREIILTGINLAAWGSSDSRRASESRLPVLLEKILNETSMPRIRFSSLGPEYLNNDFFDLFSESRLCDYLHLSVQSGSQTVLERMRRGHGVDEIHYIAEAARKVRPDVALACDMIVGFPGETQQEFAETMVLSQTVGFAKMHVFPFSPRSGTAAAEAAGQLDNTLKKERSSALRQLARSMRKVFIDSQMGKRHEVLVESSGTGLTGNYIRLHVDAKEGDIRSTVVDETTLAERY